MGMNGMNGKMFKFGFWKKVEVLLWWYRKLSSNFLSKEIRVAFKRAVEEDIILDEPII